MMPEDLPQDRPLDPAWLSALIERALDEDLGATPGRDVTTQATIPPGAQVTGEIVVREDGVVAGVEAIALTLEQVASRLGLRVPDVDLHMRDGQRVESMSHVADIAGAGHVILIAERTILNVLSRASGIATHTHRWVQALADTSTQVLDTRKTTPGLRELEKYAVRMGGGTNKRMGLYDCAMIKDNHILAAGSVTDAIVSVRERFPEVPIQVEVERVSQGIEAMDAGCRYLMLDNMSVEAMTALVVEVRVREAQVGPVSLEATGGLSVDNAARVAATGVDYVSVGALTHSSPILDIALDLH
jgi:nicotinate-nucleotide pyrophosphorylase (carboxylating)